MTDRPHVLLDCTAIPANHGGVARYIHGLLTGFDREQVDLTLVTQNHDRSDLASVVSWASVVSVPRVFARRPLRLLWEQLALPFVALRVRADVIHSPHYTFPVLWRRGRVVTIHDATFFSDPESHRPTKRHFFRAWIRLAWRHADVVVTPSAATAGEVELYIGPSTARVEVAHLGVDAARFHRPTSTQSAAFRRELGFDADASWFAFLGTIEPRKNLSALLDAYAIVRAKLGTDAPPLLVSGGRGWDTAALAKLDALGADSGVRELGYLPLASLPALLGGAVAVMYPSLGEGFGLPVLEAMACGGVVVTTNRLALPEVGGDAVVYTDVDAESIAEAMLEVHSQQADRARMTRRSVKRAKLFTWQTTAKAHVDAYRAAVRPSPAAPVVGSLEPDSALD